MLYLTLYNGLLSLTVTIDEKFHTILTGVFVCFFSCTQLLWNYKLNLTTDPKFESVAREVCKSTISEVGCERILWLFNGLEEKITSDDVIKGGMTDSVTLLFLEFTSVLAEREAAAAGSVTSLLFVNLHLHFS